MARPHIQAVAYTTTTLDMGRPVHGSAARPGLRSPPTCRREAPDERKAANDYFGHSGFTAGNYAHTVGGRAHQSLGYVYADGSDQAMGLWNTAVVHTLRRTGADYHVLADGQC